MPQTQRPFEANGLLRMLPSRELETMRPDLHHIAWAVSETIYEAEVPLRHVYFPVGALCSNIIFMENGAGVETSTIGREGMVGAHAALGSDSIAAKAICQVAGETYCMRLDKFKAHLQALPAFRELLARYNVTLFHVVSQTAACNRLHHVNERLARWLLMTHDRVFNPRFPLTQEFLSLMLGVNRPSVTIAAAALQQAGFITYKRGIIEVKDRAGLEGASCECYRIVTREFDRLLPNGVPSRANTGSV
jgi:CRP-like cAMP-binding protein